jgi:hypothetical protein
MWYDVKAVRWRAASEEKKSDWWLSGRDSLSSGEKELRETTDYFLRRR